MLFRCLWRLFRLGRPGVLIASFALAVGVPAIGMFACGSAAAQMMLPGANNGNAIGAPPRESGTEPSGPAPLRPTPVKAPDETAILGQTLSRDGKDGKIKFDMAGNDLALTGLTLLGEKISKPQQACSVSVAITKPIVLTPAGRPSGTLRFDVPLQSCPFTIDVLDGAVLVSRADPTCDFPAADCRVTPGGLWGPTVDEITPERASELERERLRLETAMRSNFRVLIKRAGKDRAAVKDIARDQAAFSSQREMTCRDYDREAVHGFCSTQITQARALALVAKFGGLDERPAEPRRKPSHPKPKVRSAGALRPHAPPVATPVAAPAPTPAAPR